MTPRFSIVTPSFNRFAHLPRCVGSVRGQRAEAEHIIQDGGSTDGTVAWLRAQPDLQVSVGPDRGMYDAVNRGWARARGAILSWLNADEQYLPGTLDFVAAAFDRAPKADALFGDTIVVGPEGEPVADRREIPLRALYVKNAFLYTLSCTLFFRRRLLDDGRLVFDPAFRVAGDADLVLRLLAQGARFLRVRRHLGLFGVDGGNLSLDGRMEDEALEIRRRHRAFASPTLRAAVKALRGAELVLRGCRRRRPTAYDFALDATPTWTHVEVPALDTRFSYDTALEKLRQGRAGGDAPHPAGRANP